MQLLTCIQNILATFTKVNNNMLKNSKWTLKCTNGFLKLYLRCGHLTCSADCQLAILTWKQNLYKSDVVNTHHTDFPGCTVTDMLEIKYQKFSCFVINIIKKKGKRTLHDVNQLILIMKSVVKIQPICILRDWLACLLFKGIPSLKKYF